MKLCLPSLLRRLLIAATTVTGVTIGTSNSYGSVMNSDVPLTTYTDFGQNMGWYKTDADANALLTWIRKKQGGVTIDYTGGQETYTLEHKMINFTGVSDNGAFMSLGYNATTSVEHNGVFGGSFTSSYIGADNSIFYQGIEYRLDGSETFLHSPQGGWDKGGFDHKVTRMSKVITDVETATLFSGTSAEMRTYVVGEQLYHTGAGTMKMYDTETDTVNGLTGAYAYIVGGIETIDGAWAGGKDNDGDRIGDYDVVSSTFNTEGHESVTTYEPLPFAGQQGDSGSPVFVYNTNTGQYEYIAAVQSIGGGYSTHYYGGIDYVRNTLGAYDKLVQSDAAHATLHIGAVSTQGETISANDVAYNYGMEATVSTTKWLGTVTGGAEAVSFAGVKSGINTWLDLSAVKDTNNWYNYENAYLNAAPYITGTNATAGKQLTYADLFVTENLVFAAGTATTDIILDATVDLGIGYAQFSLGGTAENPITSATFKISSGGDGSYQFNHAGYVIDAGVDVHTTLTGSATHMYEWRKVGAGNLHIEGSGNNNILLNVGGAGKAYLNRTDGYAAYNVLANTYATVVISDINQIARDFTFGHQGGVLDMNGNSMEWNNGNADVSAAGFTIHALDEQAIVANLKSGSATTLTWTQGGAQTFLGSFADNGKDSALKFVYNGGEGASLALHSIKTSLTAPGSGIEVQSGTLSLSGTNTVHGTGSESGKNANRYHSDSDWHYADAAGDVTVQNGGTFELGSHARLTGDVTVEQGGTFLMREGVQHAQEYVEGSTTLMNTDAISAFFGLKGDVKLSGGTMRVAYGSGVTANNTYSGNITGSGSVEIDLGSDEARFTLTGKNSFTGSASLVHGLLLAGTDSLGSNVGWYLGSGGTLQVTSGLTAANALGYVAADSTGTLALTEDMGALDMSTHTGLFIGAAEGATIQYGTAEESIAPAGGNYNLGGGGGELVVNAALSGSGNLVLGNGQGLGGIVTLTNTANSIGSITFNPGVTLSFSDAAALGGADINLVYGSSLLGSSDSAALLNLIQSGSQGAILLDRAGNANFDMSNDGGVALSASGNVTYSGNITVASGGTYRFGGGSGTLTLTQALAVNGSNGLIIDGQNSSGGKVILGAVSGITGQVKVQGYQANTTPALGDITLGFTVDNALASASGVIVARGGVLDVGSTTQTLNNVQISVGGLLKGNSDGTLIFNMTGSGQSQYGAMQLGKAEKIGAGELCLTNTNYSWELLTIKEGTVFTQVDNALSATGTTRVEGKGVLNMNTWNGEGYRGRTMHGNVVLADGGTLSAGTGNDYAITFNGTIAAAEGSTGTITNGSSWILNSAENNIGGGTLVFNAPRLELNQTIDQHIGGTLDIGANSVTLYSGGAGEDMLKHLSHVNVSSGKTLNLSELTWNTIWQIDKLSGAGTINWDSTTTHDKTARVILSGDGGFSGTINMLRRYNHSGRSHQAFIEINGENAVSGATLNFAGTGASSYASLAINADHVNIGGLQSNVSLSTGSGDSFAHIFAGAAPELSASTTATASSRKATLTITGSGDYTYGGHVGSTADTKDHSLNITMNGAGTQTFNGATIVVNDLSALQGRLNVQVNNNTSAFTVLGDVNVAQGATLNLAPNVGYEDYAGYADFTLGSGHVLNVLDVAESTASANFYANLVLGGGSLNFDVAELVSGADYAMLNLEGKAVSYAANTSALTISLSNTSTLGVGTYYLADGDWSGISASSISVDGMPHMTGTFTATASGLWLELVKRADSRIWAATEQSNSWKTYGFGSSLEWAEVKGSAVFDDSAGYTTVNVAAAQDLENMIFNAFEKDYTLNAVEYGVTTDNLYQQGGSTTTLLGTVTVESKTVVENGELVVTSNTTQTLGTISGDGMLTVDWGQEDATTSGTLNITDIGTLHVKSGVYTTGDNLTTFAADKVQVDAGATLTMGANTTMSSAVETAGTITTNSGEFTGGVTLAGDATINVTANDTALRSALIAADYTLTKTGAGTLQIAHSDISAKQIDVQDGTMQIGVQVAEGLQRINMARGKTLRFDWGGGVTNTEILLGAGSKLQAVNGGDGVIDVAVMLNGSYAFIQGGRYNGGCTVDGTISTDSASTRTLTLTNEESHSWHLASAISGNIKLDTFCEGGIDPSVTISGDNSFTGGVLLEYGTITTSHANALGTGQVVLGGYGTTSDGKLLLNKDLKISSLSSAIDYNGNVSTTGTLSLNKKTLTVGAYDAVDAEYAGSFNTALIGSIEKIGTNSQKFTNATVKVDDVSVQGGTLALSHADAQIAGNIFIGTETGEGVLNMAGTYTLNQGKTLSILSTEQSTLGGLTLNGGFIELLGSTLSTEEGSTPALNITGAVQGDALTILLAGGMPTEAGEYLLLGGNFANVSAGGVSVAVQEPAIQTFALARSGEETPELFSSVKTTDSGLYLVLSENADSNIWAGTDADNTWSSTQFSVYGTSLVGTDATAIFDSTATNKSVNVSGDVSVGGMSISGGGYSFGGDGTISLSGQLSVSNGGDASTIDKIHIPTGPITVDGSELTIIELTPTNPSAPIQLSHAAKLTIGDATHRYGSFSGLVTGDAGSQLHLYTTQVDDNYWQEDGRVHLLDGSTVQDVYIHGDLALNKFSNDGNQTNLQDANLHMDAGSQLVVRSTEATLAPTTGDIVMHGDLSLQAYGQVAENTTLTTDFTLAEGATGTLKKIDGGSITLSGAINVSGITVETGKLKLTGSSISSTAYSVAAGAELVFSGTAGSAAASSALVNATGAGNLTLDGVDATWAYDNASDLTGKLTIRNATLTSDGFDGNVNTYKTKTTYDLSSFTSVELDGAIVKFVGDNPTWQNVKVASGGAEFSIRDMGSADSSAFIFSGTTTLEGTLKLSTTGWKSQINIESLTGSGDINVVGAGEYVRVKISSTNNYTGDIAVSGNLGRLILENASDTSYGSAGATVTLSGANLWMNGNGALTLNSTLVVNRTGATAESPSTSILRNDSGSGNRVLSAVQIEANNTLELQSASNVYTVWQIQDLSGSGHVLWTSHSGNSTSSQLVLSGDGSDYTGNITVNRSFDQSAGPYQTYVVLASDNAVKNSLITLNCTSTGTKANAKTSLAVNTANAQVAGLQSDEYAHLYAGAPLANGGTAAAASTVSNTLTITGAGATFGGTVGTANETAHLNLAMIGSGTQTFSGVAHVGDVSVSNGSLALSHANSVVHGDISVSGGALDLDGTYTLGAEQSLSIATSASGAASLAGLVLAGGEIIFDATALSVDTAALSVGTLSLSEGTTSQTINFTNADELASGRYMLAGSWTALDGLSFSSTGLNTGTATYTVDNGALYMDYVSNLFYTWDAGDGSWHDTNWDTTPDGTADGNMAFVADKVAIFETDANVTISEAVSASKLIVREGATVSLTETAALSAAAIEVEEGSTLSFATEKKGYTGNISGTGTVMLDLTNEHGNTLRLSGFEGEVYVTSGHFDLYNATAKDDVDNVAQLGSKLHIGSNGEMQISAGKTVILNADVELDSGDHNIHHNNRAILTVNGDVTGSGTWVHRGTSGTLTFSNAGSVNLGGFKTGNSGTISFNGSTTLGQAQLTQGTITFGADATITTATITDGTVNFNGATDITTATISGGTTKFQGDLKLGTLTQTGGTVTLWNTEAGSGAQKLIDKVVLGNEVTLKQYSAAVPSVYTHLGTVELSGAKATIQETNYGGAISIGTLKTNNVDGTSQLVLDFNHSADNFSLVKLGSATADAGNFAGTIKMSGTNSGVKRAAALIIENADIAKNAVIDIALPASATAEYVVGINAANTTIAGLNSTNTYTDAEGHEQTRTNQYTLFSGSITPGQRDTDNALSFNSGWIQNAGKRTLTLNVAEGGDYTFTGTVYKTDTSILHLVKTGAGSQTFSGVANVGDVSVNAGTLVLSNTGSVVHDDISVSGGSFTLGSSYTLGSGQVLSVLTGTENAVTLGGIVLAGGEMVFDASLLNSSTAALTLTNAATVGDGGSATVTLDFSKLSGALATGDYLLATGNWEGATGLTYSGMGSATLNATSTGLYLNYTNDSVYTWVGGATAGEGTADTAWSSANWDLVVDTDATNNVSWAAGKDAIFNTDATVSVTEAVTAGTVAILNGANVTLGQSGESPSLTVDSLLVADGKLTLGEQINWTGIKDITVKESGTLSLGWGTGMTATSLLLQGGTVELNNGGGNNHQLNAAITVDGSGTINGSSTGNDTDIQGSITGNGVLNIGKTDEDRNPIKISATMTDGATGALAVNITDANVVYSGAKRYTGGTTIGATGTLTVNAGGQEGGMVGEIDVYGTLKLNTGDATGWGGSNNTVSAINVFTGGTLNVSSTANQTGSGIAINLQGGTMTGAAGSNFDLGYGGSTRGHSTVTALAAADATAENVTLSEINTVNITLRQYTNVFEVQEYAKLAITSNILPITGKSHLNSEASANDTFTKTGLGELVLSGQNTFTHATTVAAGTLTLANSGALNSAVTVNEGASFKLLADTAAVSYGKAISGAGTVVKAGAGDATLSAANLSLTALDIQDGFVKSTGGMNIGTLTVAAGAGFAFDLSSAPAIVTATGYNDAITFRLDNMAVGTSYDVFQAAAGMSAANVTLTGYDTNTYRTTTNVSESGLVSIGLYYTGLVWNTAGATDTWNTTDANWNDAATAATYTDGSKVTFAGTGETVTIDSTVAPGDVVVRGTGYTLSGGTIVSTGRLSVLSGAGLTLNQAATFAGGVTVDGALGYNVAAGQEINFTNAISGSGELRKTGEGTLNLGTLNSSNISTTLKVSEGVLKFTGSATEQAQDTPSFISVLNKLETSGTGKLLVEGNVLYNYTGNEETQRVTTIDDAIEITGEWNINSYGTTGNNGYRQYKLADGADVTVGGVLWLTNKQEMVVQNGAVLNANGGIKLGHDSSGSGYTARFVVEGGEVKTTGITFRRDGNPRTGNAFIMTGGRVEFTPATATTNVIQKLNDGANGTGAIEKGEVSLTGGTLVAGESSWLMDAGSATNFKVYGVTFETAADKSITLAGNINFTPAEGANGTITKTGEGLLVFNTQTATTEDSTTTYSDSVLAGLDIQGGWVQAQQAITLSTLTLSEGAGFAYDLSSDTATLVTAGSYTGDLNFRLDNLTVGNYDLFQGSADGTWTTDNVTLSGYNADKYTVTVSSNAGLVSINVAYAGLLWDTDYSETNTWVAADGETSWNGGEGTENVEYSGTAKAIFAGEGEEITISGTVTPEGITVSGTGYAFVGEGSIGGSGKLTVENGADLIVSTSNSYTGGTVIAEGGTLTITSVQALGGNAVDGGHILGKVTGEGTLVLDLGSGNTVFATGEGENAVMGGFTGTVDVTGGTLQVGSDSTAGTGAPADFGATQVIVRNGATFATTFGYGGNSIHEGEGPRQFTTALDLMSGSTLQNIDGNIAYAGNIRFNVKDDNTYAADGTVKIQQYWAKTLEFSGLLEGAGTVEMYSSAGGSEAIYKITGAGNTYAGTYKLLDGSWAEASKSAILVLGHQNAAQYATIDLASTTAVSKLQLDSNATIAALNSTDADNLVTTTGAYTLTVSSGSFAGKLQNGSETNNTLSLTKQGNGTLTLSGANTYTGTTTVSGGTLELAGTVSMNAASNISLANGTTLLLNATNSEATMTLGNAITGSGTTTIHKKGAYETVLSGNVTATTINVKDGTNQATNAGTLTLTGATVTADTLYAAYGQVNIGAAENGNTFMTVSKVELGDSNTSDSTNGLTIHAGSTLSVTGSNSQGGNSYKQASFHLSEWSSISTLNVQGKLLVQNAKVLIGDDAANINIAGGTMATQGITHARGDYNTAVTLSLSDNGTLILGASGIDTYKPFTGTLGAGTVGMSAASTTIAENLTLNSAEGTTFDTTQYAFETNADGVATDIVRGTEAGEMTISGNISSAEGVAAKMKVAGNGTLNMNGAQNTLSGGLEVEKGATVNVSTLASISAGEAAAPATMSGAISISHADGAATIEGMDENAAATVSNSLITIAQGASLRVENIVISETSRIQGATTFAARVAGVTGLTAVDTTIQLGSGNAEVTDQPATLAQNTLVSLDGTQTAVNMAGDFTTLTVTSNALSSLTLNAGSSLTIDFSSLLSDVQIANIDLIELSFADVNVDWTQDITITGVMNGNAMTAYYLAPTETAVANVGSIYFATDSIPEPTSTTLSILALAALAARRRRR